MGGRVRTKTVKKAARVIVEKYYTKLGSDFHTNKRIAEEVAIIPSKRLRNQIAGFTTHLMKRIQLAYAQNLKKIRDASFRASPSRPVKIQNDKRFFSVFLSMFKLGFASTFVTRFRDLLV